MRVRQIAGAQPVGVSGSDCYPVVIVDLGERHRLERVGVHDVADEAGDRIRSGDRRHLEGPSVVVDDLARRERDVIGIIRVRGDGVVAIRAVRD